MNIATDLALALDPVMLAEQAGIECDPWQARFLRSTSKRILLNCHRQSGKSTAAAGKAVHTAVFNEDALVLVLSPGLRQSQELFRKCLDFYKAADRPEPPGAESALRLELDNGSRIIALPGNESTVRGYSGVRLLIIDEAARVPDELYMAVRPMLAVSGGQLMALSTPWGTRGWWYEAWRSDFTWERYEVKATECPRIPAEFLQEEKQNMGDFWYRQEYMCEFVDAISQAFTREEVDAAFKEEVDAWVL